MRVCCTAEIRTPRDKFSPANGHQAILSKANKKSRTNRKTDKNDTDNKPQQKHCLGNFDLLMLATACYNLKVRQPQTSASRCWKQRLRDDSKHNKKLATSSKNDVFNAKIIFNEDVKPIKITVPVLTVLAKPRMSLNIQ